MRETRAGQVANLNLATNERRKVDGEWTDAVEWHRVVVFGRQAESAGKYLEKGRQVIVEGRLQTSTWETKQGEKRYRTEVIAERLEFVGARDSGGGSSHRAQPSGDVPF